MMVPVAIVDPYGSRSGKFFADGGPFDWNWPVADAKKTGAACSRPFTVRECTIGLLEEDRGRGSIRGNHPILKLDAPEAQIDKAAGVAAAKWGTRSVSFGD